MKMKEEKSPPLLIEIGVYWYKDEEGNCVFDTEEMQKEFEEKLDELSKKFNNGD
ncbi:MAG: hypothetical protein RLZ10_1384 [Bacteroidota bacterium]|jgi:hypothetical protein